MELKSVFKTIIGNRTFQFTLIFQLIVKRYSNIFDNRKFELLKDEYSPSAK